MIFIFYILVGAVGIWVGWWFAIRDCRNRLHRSFSGGTGLVARQVERKKINKEKILELFNKQERVTNNDVEKMLDVSDATATNYLSELEKENKITQHGKIGHAVYYTLNG